MTSGANINRRRNVADQRQAVFARIREALRTPAPHRHPSHEEQVVAEGHAEKPLSDADAFRAWLPPVGPTLDEQIALFAQNAAALKADFRPAASSDEAVKLLAALASEQSWKRIATHRDSFVSSIAEKIGLPCLYTDAGYAPLELEHCDAGITACDALVAQTGSVLVSAPSAGGRTLSVLPPHHVVIARRGQMVPDLASALQLVRQRYAPNWPSFLSFITGPSRTGDIERILVLGAHGPKKLTILLLP
jgi:L-lactate dehydrogenase complex protein LldG